MRAKSELENAKKIQQEVRNKLAAKKAVSEYAVLVFTNSHFIFTIGDIFLFLQLERYIETITFVFYD